MTNGSRTLRVKWNDVQPFVVEAPEAIVLDGALLELGCGGSLLCRAPAVVRVNDVTLCAKAYVAWPVELLGLARASYTAFTSARFRSVLPPRERDGEQSQVPFQRSREVPLRFVESHRGLEHDVGG